MKRFTFILLSILAISGCKVTNSKTPINASSKLHTHIGESSVALMANSKSEEFKVYCTGVWVSKTQIVTAAHCVLDDDNLDFDPVGTFVFYTVNKEVHEVGETPAGVHLARVSKVDAEHDVALIVADFRGLPNHDFVELSNSMPGVGEHVYSVGHPKGLYWSFAEGTVSAYRNNSSIGQVVQVNVDVWFGNSGGGIFDKDGKLFGICSRLTNVPQMNLYVHLDYLKALLNKKQ